MCKNNVPCLSCTAHKSKDGTTHSNIENKFCVMCSYCRGRQWLWSQWSHNTLCGHNNNKVTSQQLK
jgi:hypothetical protein